MQSGKKLTPQISIEFVEREQEASVSTSSPPNSSTRGVVSQDNFRALLLQCLVDAAAVIRDSGFQMGNDELQKLATTLFIQRAKNAS